nr:ABC transporter substrate-binding protein [Bacillus piscicola]
MFVLAACGSSGGSNSESEASGSDNQDSGDGLSESEELTDITFAEPARILSFAPLYVAIESGFFEEEGINAQISSGGGGSQVTATLLSGDSQFAINAPRAMLSAIDSGADLTAIQSLNSALTYEVALSDSYMKEKDITFDSSIEERVAALSGATIGSNQIGDSGDVYLRYLLQEFGEDPSTLETVKLTGNGTKVGGMQEGIVDGGIASPPFSALAEAEEGGQLAIRLSEVAMYSELIWETVFTKSEYLEKNPDIAVSVVRALGKGIEFTKNNPGEAAASIVSYFEGVEEEMIKSSLEGLSPVYVGHGEMTQAAWDNAQDPLVEFSDMSGVTNKHDTTEDGLWTNNYIEEAFSE